LKWSFSSSRRVVASGTANDTSSCVDFSYVKTFPHYFLIRAEWRGGCNKRYKSMQLDVHLDNLVLAEI
ncbi:MAG: hypothetical protein ABL865_03840, partial [Candidatus Nitrotoga sp.]